MHTLRGAAGRLLGNAPADARSEDGDDGEEESLEGRPGVVEHTCVAAAVLLERTADRQSESLATTSTLNA